MTFRIRAVLPGASSVNAIRYSTAAAPGGTAIVAKPPFATATSIFAGFAPTTVGGGGPPWSRTDAYAPALMLTGSDSPSKSTRKA